MSYDLYFIPRTGSQPPTGDDFVAYFQSRPLYASRDGQAWYSNEDTGVYFSFELAEADPETPAAWASFNLNFNRPHFFALEALPEVEAFVHAFGSMVDDPQIDGMGEGEFDSEKFLVGWSRGNAVACKTLGSGVTPHTRPTVELEAMWRWNLGRAAVQAAAGESIFVASFMFIEADRGVKSAVVWSDEIPVLLPRADSVVLYRDVYAPRRLFRRRPEVLVLAWSALEPLLRAYPLRSGVMEYHELAYDAPPPDIRALFSDTATRPQRPKVVAAEAVLNAELFENVAR